MNRLICVLTACVAAFSLAPTWAQQSGDLDKWREEYAQYIASTIAERQQQKPNFAQDVQTTHPDFIVYIPKVEPEKLGDCYNDHFQVFDGPNGTLFATTCEATCEGAPDQHVAMFKSADGGKTWSEPKVLAGPKTIDDNIPIASWGFCMVSKSGRIYLVYNQFQGGQYAFVRQASGLMTARYSDDLGETWSEPQVVPQPRTINDADDESIPPEWIVWQRPIRFGKNGEYLVGVTHCTHPKLRDKYGDVSEFIRFENIDDDPEPKDIVAKWFMTDDKVLSVGPACEEPSIVKLPDGRLFAIMRTLAGSPYWTVSSDYGENWTKPEPLLDHDGGEPLKHPLSPCPIYDWKGENAGSGYYYTFIHNTTNPPEDMWRRGPIYLIAGTYQAGARQPVWFGEPKLFSSRDSKNSLYASTTQVDGKAVVWYPDQKFYLVGKYIGPEWFENAPELKLEK